MNNIIVYCEFKEGKISDVSFELLTKGRKLAKDLDCRLEAVVLGHDFDGIEEKVFPYGVDKVFIGDDERLYPYVTLPHTSVLMELFKREQPQIVLMGATPIGRDLGPRVSSKLQSGLTADCTSLEIGDHEDKRLNKSYQDLLYQIRPAFGGNILATIINPENRPQMATVREGVMKREIFSETYRGTTEFLDINSLLSEKDFCVTMIDRHVEASKINIKDASIIVSGGYGVGSKENFKLLFDLAEAIGGEVGASRAAVDAEFVEKDRQVGQTGVTVRPKLYIACGIYGQVQHRAGMEEASMIISINNDPNAPINQIADYVIQGNLEDIIPKMIDSYKKYAK